MKTASIVCIGMLCPIAYKKEILLLSTGFTILRPILFEYIVIFRDFITQASSQQNTPIISYTALIFLWASHQSSLSSLYSVMDTVNPAN